MCPSPLPVCAVFRLIFRSVSKSLILRLIVFPSNLRVTGVKRKRETKGSDGFMDKPGQCVTNPQDAPYISICNDNISLWWTCSCGYQVFRHTNLTCHGTRRRKHLNKVHGIAYDKLPPEPEGAESTSDIAREKNGMPRLSFFNRCIMTSVRRACAKFDPSNMTKVVFDGFVMTVPINVGNMICAKPCVPSIFLKVVGQSHRLKGKSFGFSFGKPLKSKSRSNGTKT